MNAPSKFANRIGASGLDLGHHSMHVTNFVLRENGDVTPEVWRPSFNSGATDCIDPSVRFNILKEHSDEPAILPSWHPLFGEAHRGPVLHKWKIMIDVMADSELAAAHKRSLADVGIDIIRCEDTGLVKYRARQDVEGGRPVYMEKTPLQICEAVLRDLYTIMLEEVGGKKVPEVLRSLQAFGLSMPGASGVAIQAQTRALFQNVLRSISPAYGHCDVMVGPEPVMAALGQRGTVSKEDLIAVLDAGGSTFDTSAMGFRDDEMDVKLCSSLKEGGATFNYAIQSLLFKPSPKPATEHGDVIASAAVERFKVEILAPYTLQDFVAEYGRRGRGSPYVKVHLRDGTPVVFNPRDVAAALQAPMKTMALHIYKFLTEVAIRLPKKRLTNVYLTGGLWNMKCMREPMEALGWTLMQDQHVTIAKGCADYALSVFVKKVKSRLERDAAALLEKGNDAAVLPKPFVDLFNEVDWSATEAGLKITHVLSTTVGCMMWDDKKKQSKAFCTVLAAGDKLPGGRKLDPMEVPSKEEGSAIINLEEHGEHDWGKTRSVATIEVKHPGVDGYHAVESFVQVDENRKLAVFFRYAKYKNPNAKNPEVSEASDWQSAKIFTRSGTVPPQHEIDEMWDEAKEPKIANQACAEVKWSEEWEELLASVRTELKAYSLGEREMEDLHLEMKKVLKAARAGEWHSALPTDDLVRSAINYASTAKAEPEPEPEPKTGANVASSSGVATSGSAKITPPPLVNPEEKREPEPPAAPSAAQGQQAQQRAMETDVAVPEEPAGAEQPGGKTEVPKPQPKPEAEATMPSAAEPTAKTTGEDAADAAGSAAAAQEQQAVETDTDQLEEPEPEPEAEAEEEAAMPPASDPSAQMTGAGAADAAGSEATATQEDSGRRISAWGEALGFTLQDGKVVHEDEMDEQEMPVDAPEDAEVSGAAGPSNGEQEASVEAAAVPGTQHKKRKRSKDAGPRPEAARRSLRNKAST